MFKSIRKRNAGIVAITQDISDFFTHENGSFGKSILNNSYIKGYFKMEYTDIDVLERLGIYDKESIYGLKKIDKGTALISVGATKFNLEIKVSDKEKELIINE